MLKPGVTAEDLAQRLMRHKERTEMRIQEERERIAMEERAAVQQPNINSGKNEQLLGGRKPIHTRVDKVLNQKQENL